MDDNQKRFGAMLLSELGKLDPRAARLKLKEGAGVRHPIIGVMDQGEFVPLLKLDEATKAANVMSLLVWNKGKWSPTFQRGTPEKLAKELTGSFQFLWTFSVLTAESDYSPVQ